jgi:hypothetical protein
MRRLWARLGCAQTTAWMMNRRLVFIGSCFWIYLNEWLEGVEDIGPAGTAFGFLDGLGCVEATTESFWSRALCL